MFVVSYTARQRSICEQNAQNRLGSRWSWVMPVECTLSGCTFTRQSHVHGDKVKELFFSHSDGVPQVVCVSVSSYRRKLTAAEETAERRVLRVKGKR